MKVEFSLRQQNGKHLPIANLICIRPDVMIHSVDGGMYFVETAYVRVKGNEDQPGIIYDLFRRRDVVVMHGDTPIFARPDWGVPAVERLCDGVVDMANED